MKKVLMTATVPSMIGQFNMSNINILQELGYEVHVGCNFKDRSVWTEERVRQFLGDIKEKGVVCHQIDFARSPLGITKNISSLKQMSRLFKKYNFSFVHCHTPVAGVIARIVAHKYKVKSIYTAHGFHFYDGAAIKNWMIFYPIEKFFSGWTDVMITITKEDYERAKKKFKSSKNVYVPGIGVDTAKFSSVDSDKAEIRKELGIKDDDTVLLSVGELNENKNHQAVIKALKQLNNNSIQYYVAGTGALKDELSALAKAENVENNVHFLGYRTDIPQILSVADVYILPSIREGLNVSLMEAMASGLPCLAGRIRGNVDLIDEGKGGYMFDPNDVAELRSKIEQVLKADKDQYGLYNRKKVEDFSMEIVMEKMKKIYMQ